MESTVRCYNNTSLKVGEDASYFTHSVDRGESFNAYVFWGMSLWSRCSVSCDDSGGSDGAQGGSAEMGGMVEQGGATEQGGPLDKATL